MGLGTIWAQAQKSSKITDLYSKIEVSDLTVNSIYIFLLGRGGVGAERNLSLRLRIHGNDNWLSSGSGCPPWHQWLCTSFSCARYTKDFVFVFHRCLGTGLTTGNHDAFNRIFFAVPGQFLRVSCICILYIRENAICDHIILLRLKFPGLLTATGSTTEETFAIRPPRSV